MISFDGYSVFKVSHEKRYQKRVAISISDNKQSTFRECCQPMNENKFKFEYDDLKRKPNGCDLKQIKELYHFVDDRHILAKASK